MRLFRFASIRSHRPPSHRGSASRLVIGVVALSLVSAAAASIPAAAPAFAVAAASPPTLTGTPPPAVYLQLSPAGLLAGTPTGIGNYSFTIGADNGTDPAGTLPVHLVIGAGLPGVISGLTVTPGDVRLTVAWTAPASDGGSPVTFRTRSPSPSAATRSRPPPSRSPPPEPSYRQSTSERSQPAPTPTPPS